MTISFFRVGKIAIHLELAFWVIRLCVSLSCLYRKPACVLSNALKGSKVPEDYLANVCIYIYIYLLDTYHRKDRKIFVELDPSII